MVLVVSGDGGGCDGGAGGVMIVSGYLSYTVLCGCSSRNTSHSCALPFRL